MMSKCKQKEKVENYSFQELSIQKYCINQAVMVSGPITSWEIDGETVETVSDSRLACSVFIQAQLNLRSQSQG